MRSTWRRGLRWTLVLLMVNASIASSQQPSQPRRGGWARPIGVRAPRPRSSSAKASQFPLVTLQKPIAKRSTGSSTHRAGYVARAQDGELPMPALDFAPSQESPVRLGVRPRLASRRRPLRSRNDSANCDCGVNFNHGDGQAWSADGCWDDDCPGWDNWSGQGNRWYVGAEYLLWNVEEDTVPALATVGVAGLNNPIPGALNQPSTLVLFGGDVNLDTQSGGRFRLGLWLNPEHTLAIEGGAFFLQEDTVTFAAGSNGVPILAVPFFNANTGVEDRVLLASPGTQTGSVMAEFQSRLWGAEANLRTNFMIGPNAHLDFIGGFRTMSLEESLHLLTQSTTLATATNVQTWDRFATRNHFYGGQLGAHAEFRFSRFAVELTGKLGIGNTYQSIDVIGNRIATDAAGAMTVQNGGIFAQPSNIGHRSRNDFALVPEFGLRLGCQVLDCLRLSVGYNFLYWSSVVRPGDHVDRNLNLNQPAMGATSPAVQFDDADFWVQGFTTGLELRW